METQKETAIIDSIMKTNTPLHIGVLIFLVSIILPSFTVAQEAAKEGSNTNNQQQVKVPEIPTFEIDLGPLEAAIRMDKMRELISHLTLEIPGRPQKKWCKQDFNNVHDTCMSVIVIDNADICIWYIPSQDAVPEDIILFTWKDVGDIKDDAPVRFWTTSMDSMGVTFGGHDPDEKKLCNVARGITMEKAFGLRFQEYWQEIGDTKVNEALAYFKTEGVGPARNTPAGTKGTNTQTPIVTEGASETKKSDK